jgi:hypothetical protein
MFSKRDYMFYFVYRLIAAMIGPASSKLILLRFSQMKQWYYVLNIISFPIQSPGRHSGKKLGSQKNCELLDIHICIYKSIPTKLTN